MSVHKVRCTINFIDGKQLKLSWEHREEGELRVGGIIDSMAQRETFSVVVDGQLLIIPYHNVRTIEVSPAPHSLPETVVRGARLA